MFTYCKLMHNYLLFGVGVGGSFKSRTFQPISESFRLKRKTKINPSHTWERNTRGGGEEGKGILRAIQLKTHFNKKHKGAYTAIATRTTILEGKHEEVGSPTLGEKKIWQTNTVVPSKLHLSVSCRHKKRPMAESRVFANSPLAVWRSRHRSHPWKQQRTASTSAKNTHKTDFLSLAVSPWWKSSFPKSHKREGRL